ncbi:hypothetical protein [Thermococcus gorgonarius]|uniref:Uncharacterized protein n=1 Tax=Thermococcus gorgonarius TaxID=71997 RepID=A0A2Z2M3L6_THEGO|nr:hypothetical protein [Thermococcus gorgonarius]ASJ00280.1 hypothetical protein A3K92_01690 [Thermococcus gorgonarius]
MGTEKKVVALTLGFFTTILLLGIFWNDILETANPSYPKLLNLSVQKGLSKEAETDGTYFIEGPVLSDCAAAYTYDVPDVGVVNVYELDAEAYKLLTGKNITINCSHSMMDGTVKLEFDQPLESLSVSIWVGKTAYNGENVWFQLIGTWQITKNQTVIFIHPNPSEDSKVMSLSDLKKFVEENGLFVVKP